MLPERSLEWRRIIASGLLSPAHLLVILIVALLVFGPKRLPELGRSLGGGMRSFKDAVSGEHDEEEPPAQLAPAASERPSAEEHAAAATVVKTTNSSPD